MRREEREGTTHDLERARVAGVVPQAKREPNVVSDGWTAEGKAEPAQLVGACMCDAQSWAEASELAGGAVLTKGAGGAPWGGRGRCRERAVRKGRAHGRECELGYLTAARVGGGVAAAEGGDLENRSGGRKFAERGDGPARPGSDRADNATARADDMAAEAGAVSGESVGTWNNCSGRPRQCVKGGMRSRCGAEGEELGCEPVAGGPKGMSMDGAAGVEGVASGEVSSQEASGRSRKGKVLPWGEGGHGAEPKGTGGGRWGLLSHEAVGGEGGGSEDGGEGCLVGVRTMEGVTLRRSAEQLERHAPPHLGIDGRVTSTEAGSPVTACRSLPVRTNDPTLAEPRGGVLKPA